MFFSKILKVLFAVFSALNLYFSIKNILSLKNKLSSSKKLTQNDFYVIYYNNICDVFNHFITIIT